MNLKIKKLNENAQTPTRAHESDAGLDLYATSRQLCDGLWVYGTGIAVEIPEGYVGLLCQRSSVYKYDLMLSNAVGVIDAGYRGEILFKFRPTRTIPKVYNVGERIGQLVIVKMHQLTPEIVDELPPSDRGQGGYGSSGK